MSRVRNAFTATLMLLFRRGRTKLTGPQPIVPPEPPQPLPGRAPSVPPEPPRPGWELAAIGLFGLGALSAIAFPIIYGFADDLPHPTQLMGLSIGLSFILIGAALVVTGKHLVPTEEIEGDYPAQEHPEEQEMLVQMIEESGSRLTRKRLFMLSLSGAAGALGVALLTPVVSLGPVFRIAPFFATPWRRGRRLVDEGGRVWKASDIEENDIYTAFPEGADKEELAASIVLVRVPKDRLHLPRSLAHYPADGIVAYSKICTHAGCAISLYRAPLFPQDEPAPALVCPCHYSTFDPGDGGTVLFGPAGRKLPMLPLQIDGSGHLYAGGTFDEAVGPSFWGVRLRKPQP